MASLASWDRSSFLESSAIAGASRQNPRSMQRMLFVRPGWTDERSLWLRVPAGIIAGITEPGSARRYCQQQQSCSSYCNDYKIFRWAAEGIVLPFCCLNLPVRDLDAIPTILNHASVRM
jgi:hypothetical protein